MSQMMLVRHGQANSGARDEESYDRLSDLGHQQAAWLGAYLRDTGQHFTRVYCGSMRRHQETAQGMGAEQYGSLQIDARLNEFPYFSLAQAYERQTSEPIPMTREGFAMQLERVLAAWAADELEDIAEPFADFAARVDAVIQDIASGDGPALVVTSGGLISTVLRTTLALNTPAWAQMCLAIHNTSLHHWQAFMGRQLLTQFNSVPHLDTPERRHALTHL
ncbi:histidine phosphatase family protein [Cognatishimia sp. D5M38]|uniref:Histidine phosphatase family protein n=1 Tax=Cognatishimia coralii TaxID=3083254 RepID=A0ABU8QJS9_9RHOB